MIIIVATDEEYKLAKKKFKNKIIIKTGVGPLNVYKKLKKIPKFLKVLNFGYVGSNVLPIGTEIKVKQCKLYHPNVQYKEFVYELKGNIDCYTSNDFVLNTEIKEPVVFDMELAYICSMFKNVESIKIVSDNLSIKEYEKNI